MTTCHGRLVGDGRLLCLLLEGIGDPGSWPQRPFRQQDASDECDRHHGGAHEVDPSDAGAPALSTTASRLRGGQRRDVGRFADQARLRRRR